ncbi:uncharacterized protein LOC141586152 [Silene latifolia]|uniref:uncharacterized protein LOC141586152 n=1 Tax=Silene latifolia TaxID=37657 RepID=UPI003D78333E
MEETSKVRLVRCPKCEKLLPELPDYSVYQCGACGVFLRAKKKGNMEGSSKGFEKSEDCESSISNAVTEFDRNDYKNDISKREIMIQNVNVGETELDNRVLSSKVNKLEAHVENGNVVRKPSRIFEGGSSDIRERDRFGSRRGYFEEMRPSSSNYVGQTSSNYGLDSSYEREARRATRVEDVEPEREELLRKLEELQDQLSRVQTGNNNFHGKRPIEHRIAPLETYVESEDYFNDHPSTYSRIPRRGFAPNQQFSGEPFPLHQRSDMVTHGYHNPTHGQGYSPRYEDPYESQMSRRPPPQRVSNHHHYMNPEQDYFESNPYDTTRHHFSCSCYRCYDQQHQLPPQVPYNRERRGAFGSQGYNSKPVNMPTLGSSCEPKPPHKRWSSDPKFEKNGLVRPQRGFLAKGHRYRPVASGAPFVTCRNCFELLKLPKKAITKMSEWRMSCAACSSVISFAIVDEKLVSVDLSVKQTHTETPDNVNEELPELLKRDNGSYCSEDYANSGYDFQAMDRDPSFSSTCHSLSSIKSEETHSIHSVSATTSEDERLSADDLATSRSEQERVLTIKNALRDYSLKESLATEMEVPSNEYPNRSLSTVASDKSQEDDQVKVKKGDSFFAGILKKSFRSNQTVESVKKNVVVNGHLIPDRLIKKAEKLAGPVYSGQYWYDYRAGFWGAIGGPCLGIIPPLIEEFNYPMPDKCGAGNTGVFINGRELHQKDLELLSTRGLPASKDRSYIVDITGKVTDEDTGKEVVNLGKLAPTVEKVKHGFGMRAPKAVP